MSQKKIKIKSTLNKDRPSGNIKYNFAQDKNNFKNILITQTVQKLFNEGHLTEQSTYQERREVANKLDWTIGRLNKGIEQYLLLKKEEERIKKEIEKRIEENKDDSSKSQSE